MKGNSPLFKFLKEAFSNPTTKDSRLSRSGNHLKEGEPMGSEELDAIECRLEDVLDEIELEARRLDGYYPKMASKM
ncbi:hypothetical protein IPdc08_01693 [archaeon]|nr:hypothetical protein IPdc08_01693 [archaeon]